MVILFFCKTTFSFIFQRIHFCYSKVKNNMLRTVMRVMTPTNTTCDTNESCSSKQYCPKKDNYVNGKCVSPETKSGSKRSGSNVNSSNCNGKNRNHPHFGTRK